MSGMHQNFDPKKHTLYKPIYPEKYAGDPNSIISRSSYETRFYRGLDNNPNVLKGVTEPFGINYTDPNTFKQRKYYPDVLFKCKTMDGREEVFIIEVKPHSQCKPPRKGKKKSSSALLKENQTWKLNLAKGSAAKHFCKIKGWNFKLITEKQLEL